MKGAAMNDLCLNRRSIIRESRSPDFNSECMKSFLEEYYSEIEEAKWSRWLHSSNCHSVGRSQSNKLQDAICEAILIFVSIEIFLFGSSSRSSSPSKQCLFKSSARRSNDPVLQHSPNVVAKKTSPKLPVKIKARMTDQKLFTDAIINQYESEMGEVGEAKQVAKWLKVGKKLGKEVPQYGQIEVDGNKIRSVLSEEVVDIRTLRNAIKRKKRERKGK